MIFPFIGNALGNFPFFFGGTGIKPRALHVLTMSYIASPRNSNEK